MRAWGSAAAVIAAVREDAAVEAERLRRDADAALQRARQTRAGAGAETAARDGRLDAVRRELAEAEGAADWDATVAAAADRDAWIEAVAAEGRRRLAADAGAASALQALAIAALKALPGPAAMVIVPPAWLPAAVAARAALEHASGKQLTIEAGSLTAGCLVRTPDGRVTFDNSVEAREGRARTTWRAALARCYDTAVEARAVVS